MAEARVEAALSRRGFSPVLPLRIVTLLGVCVIWEAVARSHIVFEGVVPSLAAIAAAIADLLTSASFYWNLELTLIEVAVSLLLGSGAGVIVLFGVGPGSKIAMGTLSCFFPMVLSVASGVRQVDPVLLRVGRSFHLSLLQTVTKIYLPALVPPIATGLKLGTGVAIIGCLLAEIKMSNRGLGFLIMQYYAQFRIPYMYAALLIAFAIAAGGNALIARFLRLRGK
jgi:NitT/TauT family transport system permease protein